MPNDQPIPSVASHYTGHRERLKSKLMTSKLGSLPDYEILELMLCSAKPRADMKPLAKDLIRKFGSLARVISTEPKLLLQTKGVGDSVLSAMRILQEAACRLVKDEMMSRPLLESWKAMLEYCRASMDHLTTEQFRVLYLDKKNMLLEDALQETGTIDQTPIFPREVAKRALLLDAASVILIHNHPSGNTKPSNADIQITKLLIKSLEMLNITVIDHAIISYSSYYSFKSNGLI